MRSNREQQAISLGKVYTEEKIKELSEEEVEKLFNNYEAKLAQVILIF